VQSRIPKHSIVIAGRRTSISLEDEFWDDIRQIARGRGETLSELVTSINADRQPTGNLSSALRLFVLGFYRDLGRRGTRERSFAQASAKTWGGGASGVA
jgi:predicted DNA-binding ribbon-helix-helix protein